MNAFNLKLVEQIAADLGTNPGLIEKDWFVVRAIRLLTTVDSKGITPVFSGGTSLFKGWGLIKRFSEDIDFKICMPPAVSRSDSRTRRGAYRDLVLSVISHDGFELANAPSVGDESRFFSAEFVYRGHFPVGAGLRPHIRLEMSFHAPSLQPVLRPIKSLIAQAQRDPPEVANFPCVDPVETAADKLSTLAWRVCARRRGEANDDPAIIRHLYDLSVLEDMVTISPGFPALFWKTADDDTGRGGEDVPANTNQRLVAMLERLEIERFWKSEYENFVVQVSLARPDETQTFPEALAALHRLVEFCIQTRA